VVYDILGREVATLIDGETVFFQKISYFQAHDIFYSQELI